MKEDQAECGRSTDHGGLLYHRVVRLLQVAVQDVAQHGGRVLVEVAGAFSHTVVLAPNRDVNAFFLFRNLKKFCILTTAILNVAATMRHIFHCIHNAVSSEQ